MLEMQTGIETGGWGGGAPLVTRYWGVGAPMLRWQINLTQTASSKSEGFCTVVISVLTSRGISTLLRLFISQVWADMTTTSRFWMSFFRWSPRECGVLNIQGHHSLI